MIDYTAWAGITTGILAEPHCSTRSGDVEELPYRDGHQTLLYDLSVRGLLIDAYIRSLPLLVEVYDAFENTYDADDVPIGKNIYDYDNYGTMGRM